MTTQPELRLRFAWDGTEASLEGSPAVLRRLAQMLRDADRDVSLPIGDGVHLKQIRTSGPLRVTVTDQTTLLIEGSPDKLDIFWESLEGTAQASEDVPVSDRAESVQRHTHVEYLGPGDENYRAPDSVPLILGADWPSDA